MSKSRKLIIPVGIPGCGKSTWGERFFPISFSSDAIREELSGDITNQDINSQVFDVFHERITASLTLPWSVVFADATNLRDFARAKLRDIAQSTGAETHVIVFNNMAQACKRNYLRDRIVPADVMIKMMNNFERARDDVYTEGYDSITVIKEII